MPVHLSGRARTTPGVVQAFPGGEVGVECGCQPGALLGRLGSASSCRPPGLRARLLWAEKGKRQKSPPRHKAPPSARWSRRRGRGGSRGRWARRDGGGRALCSSLETLCAAGSAEEEEEPSRGERAETKIRAASCWRVTPRVLVKSGGGENVGNPGLGACVHAGKRCLRPLGRSRSSLVLFAMLWLPNSAG